MISTVTIITGSILLILAIISILANPFFRVPVKKKDDTYDAEQETGDSGRALSVIVMVNGNEEALERNLPILLSQEYEPGFQVIIVGERLVADADELLARFGNDPRLSYTFIPDTSRYISREKLGITLGVKAAANEWCVLVDSGLRPNGNHWLQEIGKCCTDDRNIVIGYCNYDENAKTRMRFHRLMHFAYLWRECNKGTAFCSNGSNIAFRKSEFIDNDGYRGNLDIIRGEYDFIVNKFAHKGATAVVASYEGSATEEAPTTKQWHRQNIFHIHSCKHMQRRKRHRVWQCADTLILHLSWIASVCAAVYAGIMHDYILLASAALSLIVFILGRTLVSMRAIKAFDADVPAWRILPLELNSIWHYLADRLRYLAADSYDFTCHKL